MKNLCLPLVAAISLSALSANAAPVVLDFELAEGTIINGANTAGVSSITVTGANEGELITYDTDPMVGSGADPDLEQEILPAPAASVAFSTADSFSVLDDDDLAGDAFAGLGRVGIIANNSVTCAMGVCSPANDDPQGGVVTIVLDEAQFFESIDFIDLNDAASAVVATLTLADMSTVSFSIGGFDTTSAPNFAARVIADAAYLVTSISLDFNGSGAFDNLTFREVPIPGAFLLMLSGLAGFGFASRKSKAKA